MTVNSTHDNETLEPQRLHSYEDGLNGRTCKRLFKQPPTNSNPPLYRSKKLHLHSLLYSSIIDHLNELFVTELTSPPLDSLYQEDGTIELETLSTNILTAITGLFTPFSEHHPELSESSLLDRFLNIAKEGLNNGIEDTKEVLDSKQRLEGKMAMQVELITELLHQGLDDYCQSFGYDYQNSREFGEESEFVMGNDDILDDELLDRLRM